MRPIPLPGTVNDMGATDMTASTWWSMLKLDGIDTIYGVADIPIADLLHLAQAEAIRYFGFRDEQSAGDAPAIAGN